MQPVRGAFSSEPGKRAGKRGSGCFGGPPTLLSSGVIKDDMAIHAGIPAKAVNAALTELRAEESLSEVTWETAKIRAGRPIKIYFEAENMDGIYAAKKRLEQILDTNGFDLYP